MERKATIERKTAETEITVSVDLDGRGISNIDTGIGFFDHMLTAFSKHSFIDLDVKVKGDLYVDGHHSVEDTGIVLGTAIKEALGDKKGIRRYGSFMLPMDETLVMCAVDLCGRPYFSSDLKFTMPKIGELDSELIREFFYAVSYSAAMNLHLKQLDGSNNHHIAEAAFKAFAKAMADAVSIDPRIEGTLSTKGTI
ncbi:MAG: imidazoleglycerol-phosphate dehydratase HisB [Lachnospiraceae bacterium]|jgi:imidazoleglycerol-phosphate dehydratase|nr:imidazoleglycerol-phosphate dehydratase HisB [Lachnospiraceae bacterium]